jgi:hypothetical protein
LLFVFGLGVFCAQKNRTHKKKNHHR